MVCSGSLISHFVNNDYVTAEITYGTAHACHKVYVTAEVAYSIAHASQVSRLVMSYFVCAQM